MKEIFEAIAWLFEKFCLFPSAIGLELAGGSPIQNFFSFGWFRCYGLWINQLKLFNDRGEENKDPSAHSFL